MIIGIVANQYGNKWTGSFVPVLGTKYFKFHENLASARGSVNYGEPLRDSDYRVWCAYQEDEYIVIERFNDTDSVWDTKTNLVELPEDATVKHISLTFDINGSPVVAYQIEKVSYLYFYNALISDWETVTLDNYKSPFVCLSNFASELGTQEIYLCAVSSNKNMIYRRQNDRYTQEYIIETAVDDIIALGTTQYNNLKIVYTKKVLGSQKIINIATPRLGILIAENTGFAAVEAEILRLETRDYVIHETINQNGNDTNFSCGYNNEATIIDVTVEDVLIHETINQNGNDTNFSCGYGNEANITYFYVGIAKIYIDISELDAISAYPLTVSANLSSMVLTSVGVELETQKERESDISPYPLNVSANISATMDSIEAEDDFEDDVLVLMHFDENFDDEMGGAVTVFGSATADAVSRPNFDKAADFSSSGKYITIEPDDMSPIGLRDFTIEFWFRPTGNSDWQSIIQRGGWNETGGLTLINGGGMIKACLAGTDTFSLGTPVAVNTWNHIAFARCKDRVLLFKNGLLTGVKTGFDKNLTNTSLWQVAQGSVDTPVAGGVNAYFDDLRITVGSAIYVDDFVPSNRPIDWVPPETGYIIDPNLISLMQFEAPDNSQFFIDTVNDQNWIINQNNPKITENGIFGGSLISPSGSQNSITKTFDLPDDVTIEFFVEPSTWAVAGYTAGFFRINDGIRNDDFGVHSLSGNTTVCIGRAFYYGNTVPWQVNGQVNIGHLKTGKVHVCIQRIGNRKKLALDGVWYSETNLATEFNQTLNSKIIIGQFVMSNYPTTVQTKIDSFRIYAGGLYDMDNNFAPPTEQFPIPLVPSP